MHLLNKNDVLKGNDSPMNSKHFTFTLHYSLRLAAMREVLHSLSLLFTDT